jgi:hypothetical protein
MIENAISCTNRFKIRKRLGGCDKFFRLVVLWSKVRRYYRRGVHLMSDTPIALDYHSTMLTIRIAADSSIVGTRQ